MKYLLSLGVLAFIVGVLFMPIAAIWSLNTLFPALAIPLTFETYCAALFLVSLFSASSSSK